MNQFFLCVNLLRSRLTSNPDLNTIVFARTEDKDLYKKNIYPLAHINPVDAPFANSSTTEFTFEVAVLDQRDLRKTPATEKFDGNDDVQDNLNLTYNILNDLVTWLRRQNNEYNIDMVSVSSATPVLFKDYNTLDGWVTRITLSVANDIPSC